MGHEQSRERRAEADRYGGGYVNRPRPEGTLSEVLLDEFGIDAAQPATIPPAQIPDFKPLTLADLNLETNSDELYEKILIDRLTSSSQINWKQRQKLMLASRELTHQPKMIDHVASLDGFSSCSDNAGSCYESTNLPIQTSCLPESGFYSDGRSGFLAERSRLLRENNVFNEQSRYCPVKEEILDLKASATESSSSHSSESYLPVSRADQKRLNDRHTLSPNLVPLTAVDIEVKKREALRLDPFPLYNGRSRFCPVTEEVLDQKTSAPESSSPDSSEPYPPVRADQRRLIDEHRRSPNLVPPIAVDIEADLISEQAPHLKSSSTSCDSEQVVTSAAIMLPPAEEALISSPVNTVVNVPVQPQPNAHAGSCDVVVNSTEPQNIANNTDTNVSDGKDPPIAAPTISKRKSRSDWTLPEFFRQMSQSKSVPSTKLDDFCEVVSGSSSVEQSASSQNTATSESASIVSESESPISEPVQDVGVQPDDKVEEDIGNTPRVSTDIPPQVAVTTRRASNRLAQKRATSSHTDSTSSDFEAVEATGGDVIRCICRMKHEGQFMIACDQCDIWQHGLCVGVKNRDSIVDSAYLCERCDDGKKAKYRPQRARDLQKRWLASREGKKYLASVQRRSKL